MYFQACELYPLKVMASEPTLLRYLDFEKAPVDCVIRTSDTDKVPGLWADETGHRRILELIGLSAKTYALRFETEDSLMKNKGITDTAVIDASRQRITFEDYRRRLFENQSLKSKRTPIASWRRTEPKDIPEIEHLLTKLHINELFGDVNVADTVSKANLSLIQENENGNIVSHVSLCSFPNVPAVPSNYWLQWAWTLYRVNTVTVRNTLFIHLLVWDPKYSNDFLGLLLHSIFTNSFYLQHILLVVPPHARTVDIFKDYFTCILPLEETDFKRVQTLLLCLREHHVPRLKLRRTKEEDNDDLVAILRRRAPELTEYYGDYYIAEMVAYPDYERKMITAEDKNTVMGVISLSKNIDYNLLNAAFELGPFQGLGKPHRKKEEVSLIRSFEQFDAEEEKDNEIKGEEEQQRGEIEQEEQEGENYINEASKPDLSVLYDNKTKDMSASTAESEVSLDSESTEVGHQTSSSHDILQQTSIESLSFSQPETTDTESSYSEGNAFKVELFALHEDWDDRYCFDFLLGAFMCYPDLDYCIVAFPSKLPKFPLLEHFVRAIPKRNQDFDQELYICHRNSILSEFIVRPAVNEDLPAIHNVIQNTYGHERIYEDCIAAITAPERNYHAYVVTSECDIVGLAVLCQEDDPSYFKAHYDVHMYMDTKACTFGSDGTIKHLTMSPVFSNHTRFFLQEICRLSNFINLYYPLYPDQYDVKKCVNYDVSTSVTYMIPVKPRKQIIYDMSILEHNIPGPAVLQNKPPYALYYIGVHHCSLPKLFLGAKIVVVGASETALAFLETTLYGPSSAHIGFNNVNIVSIQVPEKLFALKALNMLFVNKTRYTPGYMPKIGLRTWVNFIEGRMTGINRQEKYIIVNGNSTLTYDYLLLFCGVQYQAPQMNPYSDAAACIHGKRVYEAYELPSNVFVVNTQIDAVHAFSKLNEFILQDNQNSILVYGESIHVYCCIAAIREYGIPGEKIILIEPHVAPLEDAVYISNNKVAAAVSLSLKEEGITAYSGYRFSHWSLDSVKNSIYSTTFKSFTKAITLMCGALFYYGELDVSLDVFNALHENGLVYDGRLVIDPYFRTNDQNIFAAGTLTKYARRFYADEFNHTYYNSEEVGEKLAEQMLKIWNPTAEKHTLGKTKRIPPVFKRPVTVSCTLPKNFNYLCIKMPGRTNPFQDSINEIESGTTLETGTCRSQNGYFRIHINLYNKIDEIICYTKNNINVPNLIDLYGLPEKLLQNLILRFNMGAIPDFYTFFSEPWCYALYHDHFPDLRLKNKSLFESKSLTDNIRKYFEEKGWSMVINPEVYDSAKNWFIEEQYEKDLESNLQQFLTENSEELTMYASKNIIKQFLRDLQGSMLFHKRETE